MTEFRASFRRSTAMTMIADQLGVPRTDLAQFKEWSRALADRLSGMLNREQLECAGANISPLVAAFICVGTCSAAGTNVTSRRISARTKNFRLGPDNDAEHHSNLPLRGLTKLNIEFERIGLPQETL